MGVLLGTHLTAFGVSHPVAKKIESCASGRSGANGHSSNETHRPAASKEHPRRERGNYSEAVSMKLAGSLALRDNEPVGACSAPPAPARSGSSTRSAVLVLREEFCGATRFDEFAARAALSDATTSARLRDLERVGILDTRPDREPGQRRRNEYVLTPMGGDLVPVVLAPPPWANRHDPPACPPTLHHEGCGDITVSAPGPFGLDDPVAPDVRQARGA